MADSSNQSSEVDRAKEERSVLRHAESGRFAEVLDALERHSDLVNCKDKYGRTPLHYASMKNRLSEYGHLPVVEALLARGADGNNQTKNGWTPLHLASHYGHLSVVEALLLRRADGNIRDKLGWTPLHWATQYGHLPVVEALLARGADVKIQNKYGWTPLHLASYNGDLPVVEALLARGAEGNFKEKNGRTPLDLAMSGNQQSIVTMLQRHMKYQGRREFMMFLSEYQFLEPPARFPRESVVEKVLVIEDIHRYLTLFL